MAYKIRKRFDWTPEVSVVTDFSSQVRPDLYTPIYEQIEKMISFPDLVIDDSEDLMDSDKIDTSYSDKLDLAQLELDLRESHSQSSPSSSPAEQSIEENSKGDDVKDLGSNPNSGEVEESTK